MKYLDFRNIYLSLDDCDSEEMFIHERGWQDWMEEYADDESGEKITNILHDVWCMKGNIVKGLKSVFGLTQKKISEEYGIPIRTVEQWSSELKKIPPEKACMLAFCVFTDQDII